MISQYKTDSVEKYSSKHGLIKVSVILIEIFLTAW